MDHPATAPDADREDAGFSLLELMVVVVILSILALVIVPRVINRPDQARVVRVQTDLAALESAVNLYKLDNFRYPTTEQGLEALVTRPSGEPAPANWSDGGYIERLPKDPWGNDYQYLSPGVHGEFDIFTLSTPSSLPSDALPQCAPGLPSCCHSIAGTLLP